MKIAVVTPIFKANDPQLLTKYRPVSVLPMLSQSLEHIMYSRLIEYLNRYKILCKKEFSFQNKYSTYSAVPV